MYFRLMRFTAGALVVCSCAAHAAPLQLLNKSIRLEMTVTIPAKTQDGASVLPQQRVSQVIYISSQGRLFQKIARRGAGAARKTAHTVPTVAAIFASRATSWSP